MKKRSFSLLVTLLALTLLFSSCAAGLPGAALLSTLKDSVGDFKDNVTNLFSHNAAIISNGKSNYVVRVDENADESVKEKVNLLFSAIKEKTGVDLLNTTAGADTHFILIGNTGQTASLNAAKNLNGSTFYLGFSGKNLVIQATNSLMLGAALDYLTSHFISKSSANIGEGYFFLPGNLNYTSETLICSDEEFSIITAASASSRTLSAANTLRNAILSAVGADLRIKNDLVSTEENAKEIVLGTASREQSEEILARLTFSDYYIGINGNKILILAVNDQMLEYAVSAFVSAFLTATDAALSTEAETFTVPAVLSIDYHMDCQLLTDKGENRAVLVYPATLDSAEEALVSDLCSYFKKLTGCELLTYKDTEYTAEEDTFEILLGETNRPASLLAMTAISAGNWSVNVSHNALTLSYVGKNNLRVLVDRLKAALRGEIEASNSNVYNERGGIIENVNRLLFLSDSFALSSSTAPDITATASGYERCGENAYVLYQQNATKEIFDAYIFKLQKAGYIAHEVAEKAGNVHSATYHSKTEILNVTWCEGVEGDDTLRVVVDPVSESALGNISAPSATGIMNVEPLFIQLGGSSVYTTESYGMSYAVRLRDGSFIVIDGGDGQQSCADELLRVLEEYNVLEGKPLISCWIITHAHIDHLGVLRTFSSAYATRVELLSVLFNFPSDAQTTNCAKAETAEGEEVNLSVLHYQREFRSWVSQFSSDVTVYKARTGAHYAFAGCSIEMLFTFEDYQKPSKNLTFFNDSSLVFRLTLSDNTANSKTFLMLGDASEDANAIITARYGSYLKSDAVQVAHHGFNGGIAAVYNAISAPVVFWPTGVAYTTNAFTITRNMLKKSYAKVCYVAYHGTEALTLAQIADGVAGTPHGTGRTASAAANKQ